MIKVTYYEVQAYHPNNWEDGEWKPANECNWEWAGRNQDRFTDLSEAEECLAKEEARWQNFLAEQEDKVVDAHVAAVRAKTAYRIVKDVVDYKYACHYMYTDVHAYEIVKLVSDKTIEVRKMDTEHDISHLKQYSGGFCGHVAEQRNQKVTYASNPNNEVIRIRKKKNGGWGHKALRFGLNEEPYAFYDYNF
jgi:hypothetical protein|tara:strand:+ start:1002 stop:1577 length:576 start_codon:yes stop_codon:yes gene_type:complete